LFPQFSHAFQSTPPRGGDHLRHFTLYQLCLFQSTPPRGGDLAAAVDPEAPDVSIHAPARGRHNMHMYTMPPWVFQSTPPRGGDLPYQPFANPLNCFNPRPRAGATGGAEKPEQEQGVSIHAPARGRREGVNPCRTRMMFQSTPPRGGDKRQMSKVLPEIVSIHAPARGRPFSLRYATAGKSFNPRPRAGATDPLQTPFALLLAFQSTPPRGGDKLSQGSYDRSLCFNPRPRAGATSGTDQTFRTMMFQSTPPRGGDPTTPVGAGWDQTFQSTPPRGGDEVRLC